MNVKIIVTNVMKMHFAKIPKVLTNANVTLDMLVTDLLAKVTMNVAKTEPCVTRKPIASIMETAIHVFVELATKVMVMIGRFRKFYFRNSLSVLNFETNSCQNIDECANNGHKCSIIGTCIDRDGGYTCQCPEGYRFGDEKKMSLNDVTHFVTWDKERLDSIVLISMNVQLDSTLATNLRIVLMLLVVIDAAVTMDMKVMATFVNSSNNATPL